MRKSKCPYGLDCVPDEACLNCRGLIKCPKCGTEQLIPVGRKFCFDCWNKVSDLKIKKED